MAQIKCKPSCIYGTKNLHQTIILLRYLRKEVMTIIDPIIRKCYFFKAKHIFNLMFVDKRDYVLTLRRIIKTRRSRNSLRTFRLFEVSFEAKDGANSMGLLVPWLNPWVFVVKAHR